ncbi:hypothetical protein GCM10027160_30660 [Streptomyces calidiresistens]|uniref:Helix-turn-helix domain-containing protein n=1 Tax=Streptomyces calidiresistens TaxID=1485586 RepID=A0A7W3XX80_9ACTN|nr:helix-turn-helix domain-containing protein [Streptomyces calidiresistens]MBB0230512.1 helix-turn-helix domain-containing protein [Streptomyces calidiresistens]
MAGTRTLVDAVRIEPDSRHEVSVALRAELDRLSDAGASEVVLRLPNGRETAVPVSLLKVLAVSAHELASGRAITVLASEVSLTPTEAADILGLSRPFLVRLLDRGDIPSTHLPGSRHRRIRLGDVVAFHERRMRRREGRRRIAEILDDGDESDFH